MSRKILISCYTLFISWAVSILISGPVQADGGMFFEKQYLGNPPESPGQRAVIFYDQGQETLVLQVKYQGELANFSWVIPVPGRPDSDDLKTTDDAVFNNLYRLTQPAIYFVEDNRLNGGYTKEMRPEDASQITELVQVWEQLTVGPYDASIISTGQAEALVTWLNDNGYRFPDQAAATIDYYVAKEWYFVALKVNIAKSSGPQSSAPLGLPPIQLSFPTDQIVFPLRISEISAASESEIILYVVTEHRTISNNYHTRQLDLKELRERIETEIQGSRGIECACRESREPEFDYETYFRNEISKNPWPVFVVEYAGYAGHYSFNEELQAKMADEKSYFLTRFRTYLKRADMSQDVSFITDPAGDEWFSVELWYSLPKASNGLLLSMIATWVLFLFPVGLSAKFRRKYGAQVLLLLLLLMIALG